MYVRFIKSNFFDQILTVRLYGSKDLPSRERGLAGVFVEVTTDEKAKQLRRRM
jgi:hypothetical protein